MASDTLMGEIKVYKTQLDQWVKSLGLPQYQPETTEVEDILGFTRAALRERSSTQLSEDAVILMQYALFLQQKANECQTFTKWSGQVANRIQDEDKHQIYQWVKRVALRLERIQYLARRIEMISQSISGLVRARYNEGRC